LHIIKSYENCVERTLLFQCFRLCCEVRTAVLVHCAEGLSADLKKMFFKKGHNRCFAWLPVVQLLRSASVANPSYNEYTKS